MLTWEKKLNKIENDIALFKRSNNFSNGSYLNILNGLNKLFNEERCNINFSFSDKETKLKKDLISTERKNFKKYLIDKFLEIIEKQKEMKEYEFSLESIKKLEEILKNEFFDRNLLTEINNKIHLIKSLCELEINIKKVLNLLNNENYEDSISLLQNFILISKNNNEFDIYKKYLDNVKTQLIFKETKNNINLIKSENYKDVIINFEKINEKYKNESSLEKPLKEAKIPYGYALKKLMEEKNNKKENFDEEIKKYFALKKM